MNQMIAVPVAAAATTAPSISSEASPTEVCSFPELAARFVRIHQRWSAQRESDEAYRERIGQLFFGATGVSMDDFHKLDWEDEQCQRLRDVYNQIGNQNPDPNSPNDEDGCSIAWAEIQDELDAVEEEMLDRTPESIVDLAWQAAVLWTADAQYWDGDVRVSLRQLFKNIRALASLMSPASSLPPPSPAPIER